MGDCACGKPGSCGCCPPQCAIPVVPPGVNVQQVNPCPPPPCVPCEPCCYYNVPIIQQTEPPCPCPRPRRKCRYIQPERPKSFKPKITYKEPASKMDDNTIYRKSYLPVECDVKPELVLPYNNLCLGEGKMSDNTVNRMSYMPHCNVLPACPIFPCEHKLLGEGPMQDITTNKHDYVPKPFSKPVLIPPSPNLFSSDCPISDKTTNKMSYMPVNLDGVRVEPFRPKNAIEQAKGKFSDDTVHRMSYLPWEQPEPIDKPWAKKPEFAPPIAKMADNTVHKMSYMPPGCYVECDDNDPNCVDCPEGWCPLPPVCRGVNCCLPCCCPKAAC